MSKLTKPVVFCIFILMICLFGACENPFSNNLGEKVVVEPPTVNVDFPISGSFLSGVVTFNGHAKAYIEVRKVEIYIYANEENGQREVPWTDAGVILRGSTKEKTWSFRFDTSQYNNWDFETKKTVSPRDGTIKMKFRVYDNKAVEESVDLVYIIKNLPSDVRMTSPDGTEVLLKPNSQSRISIGSEIQGQIIDRRGLRPGYPQIKFWPADDFPNNEPDDDDPRWGWASLFLPGIGNDDVGYDDLQKEGDGPAGPGAYADRGRMPVVRAAQFSFRLAEYSIEKVNDELRYIRYRYDGGRHIPLPSGRLYKFRIRTKDTASDPLNRSLPTDDPPQIEGFFPPFALQDGEDYFRPRAEPVTILIVSADTRPTIELNNDDIRNTDPSKLTERPNIYITEPTTKKIATGADRDDFRLRVLINHPDGIEKATLQYIHESTGRAGFLKWDDTPGGLGYVTNTNDVTKSEDGHRGEYFDTGNPGRGKIFTFTAKGNLKGVKPGNDFGNLIFTTHSEPYTLVVTVSPAGGPATSARYVLYMDGDGPNVSIRSVRGAAAEPASGAADLSSPIPGFIKNGSAYTVNGNIQVVVDRTDNSGIMNFRSAAENGKTPPPESDAMVKWIVEEVDPASPGEPASGEGANTVLAKLIKFKKEPIAKNLEFFNDIDDTRTSGWVRRPVANAANDADRANNFKFNTFRPDTSNPPKNLWNNPQTDADGNPIDNNKYLWLYVIAQDGVQNLGFIVQKIRVDDDTDKPKFDIPVLSLKNAGGTAIAEPGNLDVTVDANRVMSGNWSSTSPRRNILEKNQGIDLNFIDDDGINLGNKEKQISSGVTIKLTDLNTPAAPKSPATLDADLVKKVFNVDPKNERAVFRDMSGALSQEIMAEALYGLDDKGKAKETHLKDGIYKIEITVTDDVKEKVEITPNVNPGDKPEAATAGPLTYYFAVFTELPEIVVETPEENSLQNTNKIDIKGYARSRLNVQKMWITFNPDIISSPPKPDPSTPGPLTLYSDPACTVPASTTPPSPDAEGFYTYYWIKKEIVFNPVAGLTAYDWRRFTLEAYDRLGNLSSLIRTVQIDTAPPDVILIDFNYNRPGDLYGKVPFTVSASDASGLFESGDKSGIKWWIIKKGSPEPDWDTPTPFTNYIDGLGGGNFLLSQAEQGGRYTGIIDTRKLPEFETGANPPRIEYQLCIIARDKAGNQSVVKGSSPVTVAYETFKVDQDGDYPVIDPNSLDPAENGVKGKENLTIKGTVSDGDLFNAAKLGSYVEIRFPTNNPASAAAITWGAWVPVSGNLDPSRAIIFTFTRGNNQGNYYYNYLNTDGTKYYQIRVSDEPEKGAENYGKNPDGAVAGDQNYQGKVEKTFPSATTSYSFLLDDTPPVIRFTNYDPTQGHPNYSALRPTFSTAAQLAAALSSDLSVPPDAGKLGGTVVEAHLSTLSFTYGTRSGIITTSGSDNKWSLTAASLSEFDSSSTPQGPQSIVLEAIDVAGLAHRVSWTFSKDTEGPEVVFKNIAKAVIPSSPANTVAPSVVSGDTGGNPPLIQGTFIDGLSNLASSFDYRFDGGSWLTKAIIPIQDKKNTADWEIALNSAGGFSGLDGLHKLDIRIRDSAGNENLISNIAFLVDRANPSLTASADFTVTGTSIGANLKLDPDKRVFSAAGTGSPATDEVFTLSGRVSDFNLASLQITIGQDVSGAAPYTVVASWQRDIKTDDGTWVVTEPVDQLTSGGSTGADSGIKRLTVTPVASSNPAEWTWTLKVLQKDIAGLRAAAPDGTKDSARRFISVTASDKARKRPEPTAQVWNFFLDTRKPDIEYTTLEKGRDGVTFENNNFSLSGTVSDDTGIREVRYMIGKWDYTAGDWRWYNGTSSSWTALAAAAPANAPESWPTASLSATNWSINQATLNAAPANTFPANLFDQEGRYRLDLYVRDWSLGAAPSGNPHNTMSGVNTNDANGFRDSGYDISAGTGFASARVFYIDKNDPKLAWVTATNNKTYFKNESGQVNLGFTAGDNNTIQRWEAVIRDEIGAIVLHNWTSASGSMASPVGNIPVPSAISFTVTTDQNLTISPFMTVGGTAGGTALDIAAGALPKTYTITLTVVDGAKKSSSISKQFILDNRPPAFDNFRPASFKHGTPATYEAVTGRLNVRGNTSDNSNQLRRVAFYIPKAGPNGDTSTFNFPDPKDINDATSTSDGWRWHDPAYANSFKIDVGGTTVIQIEQGTFAWEIRVPQTSIFLNDAAVKAAGYVQWTKTGGLPLAGGASVAAKYYRDVDFTYNAATNVTTVARDRLQVPALTFQDLAKDPAKYSANDKTIYGDEDVGLITVYMLAEDMAGNVRYEALKYWIWPEGDRPQVISINNPDGNKIQAERLLNGSIRLSGLARDNEQVKYVWFKVLKSDGITPYTNLHIPEWNEADWTAKTTEQRPVDDSVNSIGSRRSDDPPPSGGPIGGGWYKANGGGSRSVSWWAYVNTQGELDPSGLDANEITVEVRVQDVTWDDGKDNNNGGWKDYTPSYKGFASTPLSVKAWVVAGAPIFDDVKVANGASDDADNPLNTSVTWGSIDTASIRNRSSYRVTVKHNSGISAVRWSPTQWVVNTNNPAGIFRSDPNAEAYNLLNLPDGQYVYRNSGGAYVTSDKTTAFNALTGANPATRMAVTVKPRGMKTGSSDLSTSRKYMIWHWDPDLEQTNVFVHDDSHMDPTTGLHKDMKNTVFTPLASGTYNIGSAVVIESELEGAVHYFKWDVTVDVRADLLMSDMLDPVTGDPNYGKTDAQGKPLPGREGQTRDSVRYPVYLSATEVSRATPLTTRGDTLLPIDNLPPTAMYTLNRRPAGLAATIGGEAGDDGPVSGIAKVVLWFSRMNAAGTARDFISWHERPETGATTLPAAGFTEVPLSATGGAGWWDDAGVIAAWNAANPGKPQVKKPYIPAIDIAGAEDGVGASAIVIDRNSPSVGQPAYGHKLPMGFADGGMGKYWYVAINSFGITSGPVTLHYVVIDKAGNAKYYYEPLVIMNNAPVINKINLATDIRDNSDFRTRWTANTRVGKGSTATPTGAEANGRNQILQYIWDRVPLGTTDVQKGITDDIYSSAMAVDKIIDFNVRNKLLAMRIETTNGPGSGKTRNFRLEYVSGAGLLENTLKPDGTPDKTQLPNMKAGRVYIINNPGSARWGAIGAEGDGPWPRGYAFLAAVDGTNEEGAARIDGTGSVWELNSSYYTTGTRVLPTALNLEDVRYSANNSGINTEAVSAEFVYFSGAFGNPDTAGRTIVDYTNTSDAWPPEAGTDPTAGGAGNSMFILRVFDGDEKDQFGDFKIIRIRVNNDDKTKPFAQLYDLNPMTEGQDRAQTRQRSLTPMFIGEGTNSNRTKGGLWNTDETARSISKPGHIEPRRMTAGYGSAATGNLYTTPQTGETPNVARNHSLSSAQMGGAATQAAATVQKPWANPAGFFPETTSNGIRGGDTVSGQVVLRGYAEDDQRIESVELLIGSRTVTILGYHNNSAENTSTSNPPPIGRGTAGESATFTPPRTGLLTIPANADTNNRVYFTDTIDLYRHRVEWAYVWDTESIPANTVIETNVNVRVRSSNRNSVAANANKQSDNTAAPGTVHTNTSVNNPGFPVGLNKYNSINVNLRPYISGFKRDGSKFFHNKRSMQGWTAFAREEVVVVEGFNLGRTTGTPAATTTISIPGSTNAAANTVTAAQQASYGLNSTNAANYRIFTVGANATPGTVTLNVAAGNDFPAVNTSSERPLVSGAFVIQPWNTENSPGIEGSDLWDDTRSVHIWQSNDIQTGNDRGAFRRTNNWYIMSPAMSIDPRDGTLWSSHTEGGRDSGSANNGNAYISANNADTLTRTASFIDPILFSDIYYSVGDGSTNAASGPSAWSAFSLFGRAGTYNDWQHLGGVYMYGPNGANPNLNSGIGSSTSNYLAESTYYNASTNAPGAVATPPSTDQFLNPHIVTARNNNYEHIHVSYYDDKDGSIKYRYNRRGTPGRIADDDGNDTGVAYASASYGWTNLDGGYDADDQQQMTGTGNANGNLAAPFTNVATNGRIVNWDNRVKTQGRGANIDAGRHNSIAVNSDGYPYVAYFDETNQHLKLAVSNSTTPFAAANWKIIDNIIPTANMSHKGTGQFVSMRIDTKNSNKIHIAALNSVHKQLVYISGYVNFNSGTNPATFGGNTNGTGAPVVQVVDSVGMVGRWCAISLDNANGNPWISYQDESNLGSMDGVKMAFLDTAKFKKAANDIYGASVSGWETMHVPAQFRVENPLDSGREHGRLGMECFPVRNYTYGATLPTKFWSGAVSFRSPDLYRIAYYVGEEVKK